jgi:hypothetical protein
MHVPNTCNSPNFTIRTSSIQGWKEETPHCAITLELSSSEQEEEEVRVQIRVPFRHGPARLRRAYIASSDSATSLLQVVWDAHIAACVSHSHFFKTTDWHS